MANRRAMRKAFDASRIRRIRRAGMGDAAPVYPGELPPGASFV
ncbi:MAG: hypothetical protein VCE91_03275 [Nitrospinota bacterium]